MQNTGEKPTHSAVFTAANSDDDVITTSTDSEIFGTWTMVKNNPKGTDSSNRVEELEHDDSHQEDETANESHVSHKSSLDDSSLDDGSDGISIISESESSGRLSPHPILRQHLNDFKRKLLTDTETESSVLATAVILPSTANQVEADIQIKHRRRKYSHTNTLQPVEVVDAAQRPLMIPFQFSPIVRKGLSALFYIGVLFGILGIVGRLYSPEWAPTSTRQPLEQLQLKFNDMELQNNLMRAEIDILTKQVNYLTNLKDHHRKGDSKGNNIPPTIQEHIHQKDQTYKKVKAKLFTEDYKVKEESVNKPETVANNIKIEKPEKSENSHENIDKIVVKEPIQETSNGDQKLKPQEYQFQQQEILRRGENMRDRVEGRVNKDYSKPNMNQPYKQKIPNSKEFLEKRKHEEFNKNKKDRRQFSHERRRLDDDFSGERFQKKQFEKKSAPNDSRERFYNYKQEREDWERSKKRKDLSREKDGRWQEEYMKHRANERHSNEKRRNDKNWFIERGDSREQIRHR